VTRPTPFDSVFGALRDTLVAIRATHGRIDRPGFMRLPAALALLDTIGTPALLDAHPEAGDEYLTLLYAAFRFCDAGEPLITVARDRLAAAMLGPLPAKGRAVPNGTCYVQLPERWIWAQVAADALHEPMDGYFAVEEPRGDLLLVAILGFRPERVGLSQVSMEARSDDVAAAAAQIRTDRFAPAMDGGSAAGVRSIVSQAELLVLHQLALTSAVG